MEREPLVVPKFLQKHLLDWKPLIHHRLKAVDYTLNELQQVLELAEKSFHCQRSLVDVHCPVTIVGDIQGQFADLLRIFSLHGFPPDHSYLFLGNLSGAGALGLECIFYVLMLKVQYPEQVHVIRGTQELRRVNEKCGLLRTCHRRFPLAGVSLWNHINFVFDEMPIAALVGNRILCVHGGLSKELTEMEDIRKIKRPMPIDERLATDLLWNSPSFVEEGWEEPAAGTEPLPHLPLHLLPASRLCFGSSVIADVCAALKVGMIVTGGEPRQEGFQMYGDGKLLALWSAPAFAACYNNAAAVLNTDNKLLCKLSILSPEPAAEPPKPTTTKTHNKSTSFKSTQSSRRSLKDQAEEMV